MNNQRALVLIACVGALSVCGTVPLLRIENAAAQEQTVECDKLPDAVRTAFQKAYPQAKIQECAEEVENNKTAYEISSIEGKTKRDILYNEDGTLIVVEEAIDASDLPKPVKQAVSQALADHTIELIERLTRDETVTYEIQSKQADVALEIVFDGNGNVLKIAAAGAEEPQVGAGSEAREKVKSGSEDENEEEDEHEEEE